MPFFTYISSILFILLLAGCNDKKSDDLTIHWDRDMCSRCVMVISDRDNAVQVIDTKSGKKSVFDDIGCMAIWSKSHQITEKDKIWITDLSSGEWIDARKAFYDAGNMTPMGYGFSAHKSKSDIAKEKKVFTYEEVIEQILSR